MSKGHFPHELTKAVLRVESGRGFIVQNTEEEEPLRGRRTFRHRRLVVTAAHCLPSFPPRISASHTEERTYKNLLGWLEAPQLDVWAECLFVNPVADIAVLGEPDDQAISSGDFPDSALHPTDSYCALTDEPTPLRVGQIRKRTWKWEDWAWLLSLDQRWVRVKVEFFSKGLWIEDASKIVGGMSGSPILAEDGTAIGVVVIGGETVNSEGVRTHEKSGPHPVLALDLPGWLLQHSTRGDFLT